MPKQFALPLKVDVEDTFDNFYIGAYAQRGICVESLKMQVEPAGDFLVYVWGGAASGRSHLLRAAAQFNAERGLKASFIHAAEIKADPSLIDHLELNADIVLIDDIDQLLGELNVETSLFALYNALRDTGKKLVVTANCSPRELPCRLADLASRLSWGSVFKTTALEDEELVLALAQRSAARGLELVDEVANFILHHAPRNASVLFSALDQLDAISLEQQRKLTIPFVKSVMEW